MSTVLAWTSGLLVFGLMLLLVPAGAAFSGPQGYDAPAKALCRRLIRSFRMRVKVEGLDRLTRGQAYVFVANHVNILDGFLLYGHIPFVFRGLELASHFSWPIYGWFTRLLGNIPVDASDPVMSGRGLRRARRLLARGISILVLPEGHRTRDGRLGRFGRGAFRLAVQSGVPLAPVAIAGAFDVLRTGSWRVAPGPVRLLVGEPFPPEACRAAGAEGLRDLARERMQRMLPGASPVDGGCRAGAPHPLATPFPTPRSRRGVDRPTP
jgi:1-acyl-sn-glycerol-3-phosphate acyltransferase